jgi:hypothetical protein
MISTELSVRLSRRFWNSEPRCGNSFGKMHGSDVSATCVVTGVALPDDAVACFAADALLLIAVDQLSYTVHMLMFSVCRVTCTSRNERGAMRYATEMLTQ